MMLETVQCVANNKTCQKSFLTISGLRNHAKKCIRTFRIDDTKSAEVHISWKFAIDIDLTYIQIIKSCYF